MAERFSLTNIVAPLARYLSEYTDSYDNDRRPTDKEFIIVAVFWKWQMLLSIMLISTTSFGSVSHVK